MLALTNCFGAAAKIPLDCGAAKDITLAGGEAITLRYKPIIKIIENRAEYGQRTMMVVRFWK
jgi:hypothetical protein